MITYKVGNLVDAFMNNKLTAIGHCCNAQATMGSGIAKEIADRLPAVKAADDFWFETIKFDNCALVDVPKVYSCAFFSKANEPLSREFPYANDKVVFNLYGQEYFGDYGIHKKLTGRNVSYAALAKALLQMRHTILTSHLGDVDNVIGFPKFMGCFRAGGNWEFVEQLIADTFFGMNVHIYSLPVPEKPYVNPTGTA